MQNDFETKERSQSAKKISLINFKLDQNTNTLKLKRVIKQQEDTILKQEQKIIELEALLGAAHDELEDKE